MNLLPFKCKSNMVSKPRVPRPPSVLSMKARWWLWSGARWRSKPVLLLHLDLEPSHVMLGHGLGYTCHLPLTIWEILSLAAPKQNINLSVSYSCWVEDTWSWAQHTQLWWEVRFGSPKSQKEICLLLNAKPGSTTAWGYFSICFFFFQSWIVSLPHFFVSYYFW